MRGYWLAASLSGNTLDVDCGRDDELDLPPASPVRFTPPSSDLDMFMGADRGNGRIFLIVGNLFDRLSMSPVLPLENQDFLAATHDPFEELLTKYWGRYVALRCDVRQRQVDVLRDPSGQLPCYWRVVGDELQLSQDSRRLAGASLDVDWEVVRHDLLYPGIRGPRTAVENIHEIMPGSMERFRGRHHVSTIPWRPCAVPRPVDEPLQEITERLKRETENCVAAWARRFPRPLLTLSGGLDSSVIAAGLRMHADAVTCLNLVSGTARGDERRFAAMVAEKFGFGLRMESITDQEPDFRSSTARHKPRPIARAFTQATDRVTSQVADEVGGAVHFNGGGGDNVFAYLHSSFPAADAFLDTGFSKTYRQTVGALRILTGCNTWTIAARSLGHAARAGKLAKRRERTDLLIQADATADLAAHPWIAAYSERRPGKRQHIEAVLQGIHFTEYLGNDDERPTIYPLLSQPLIEYCLSIPTWRWCEAGRDRSLVRVAYRDVIPEAVLERRIKGSFEQFVAGGFYRHLGTIRAMIGDGQLAGQGIIDRSAVLDAMANVDRLPAAAIGRILHFVDVEAWLTSRAP